MDTRQFSVHQFITPSIFVSIVILLLKRTTPSKKSTRVSVERLYEHKHFYFLIF